MKKIDLQEVAAEGNFLVSQHDFHGELVFLIQPNHIGSKFDKSNLIFRSSVWSLDGLPVSLSFKKFFNYGEKPDLTYTPFSMKANGGCNALGKEDGSTLIVSKYKKHLITRTRGTMDATQMLNGFEIEDLKAKYPNAFDNTYLNSEQYSLLFEWVTPNNCIVVNYPEPDIILIGMINHNDYSMETQKNLDLIAFELGVKRPPYYHYDSVKELLDDVAMWKGKEGICLYCNHDQDIRKIKGEWYLKLHRLKSELGSFERVVDFYFESGELGYKDFYNLILETIDYEVAEKLKGQISQIVDAMKEVGKILEGMDEFSKPLKLIPRKDAALKIIESYGVTGRSAMLFKILDNKEINQDDKKKLLYQVNKK